MSFISKLFTYKRFLEKPLETLNTIYISKEAIVNNFKIIQNLYPSYSIFPVLKSNAYWHGIKEVAKILSSIKLNYIVVDSYFEAMKVHEVNKTPVLLIGFTLPSNIKKMDLSNTTLVIYTLEVLNEIASLKKNVKIHIKIDTWMHRQWVYLEELPFFIEIIKKSPNIILEWICTHFADADNIENEYSDFQFKEFQKCIAFIQSKWFNLKYIHCNNSSWWIKWFGENICNSMRLWISLYWVNPLEKWDPFYEKIKNIKRALTFESTVIQIKHIKMWEKVGYNWTFIAPWNMDIAIIPVGYYEGLSRNLSNNYFYSFQGKLLPILGRVSMNLTIIDVTWIDIKVGSKIEIISTKEKNNIYEIASRSKTISYECFTRLSESIRRKII